SALAEQKGKDEEASGENLPLMFEKELHRLFHHPTSKASPALPVIFGRVRRARPAVKSPSMAPTVAPTIQIRRLPSGKPATWTVKGFPPCNPCSTKRASYCGSGVPASGEAARPSPDTLIWLPRGTRTVKFCTSEIGLNSSSALPKRASTLNPMLTT